MAQRLSRQALGRVLLAGLGLAGLSAAAGADAVPTPRVPASRPSASTAATRAVHLTDLLVTEGQGDRETAPSDEEWEIVSEFCRQVLPNRWAYFEKARAQRGDGNPVVTRIKARIAGRFRTLQGMRRLSGPDPTFYDQVVTQASKEDAAWGAARAWHEDRNNAAKLKALEDAARELVKSVLEAKEAQLSRLQEYVNSEQELLSKQRTAEASFVAKQVEQLKGDDYVDEQFRPFRRYGFPRGLGFDGPGGPGRLRPRFDMPPPSTAPAAPAAPTPPSGQ